MARPTNAGPVADKAEVGRQGIGNKLAANRPFIVDNLVVAPWGPGTGQLGHRKPAEGNPEGPMSLQVNADGKIFVLDQVNGRISVFDETGKPSETIPLPSTSVQDFAFNPTGGFVLLDRLSARSLIFVNSHGTEIKRVAIEGKSVADSGAVTAMVAAQDGVWVEYEHKNLTKIATFDGQADEERRTMEGRSFGSDMLLRAARDPRGTAVISAFSSSMALGSGYLAKVDFGAPISQLLEVSGNPAGQVTVAAHLVQEDQTPAHAVVQESIGLAVLSQKGTIERRGELAASDEPDEQFRPITIAPNGSIYHLHIGTNVATIRRAR